MSSPTPYQTSPFTFSPDSTLSCPYRQLPLMSSIPFLQTFLLSPLSSPWVHATWKSLLKVRFPKSKPMFIRHLLTSSWLPQPLYPQYYLRHHGLGNLYWDARHCQSQTPQHGLKSRDVCQSPEVESPGYYQTRSHLRLISLTWKCSDLYLHLACSPCTHVCEPMCACAIVCVFYLLVSF